MHYTPSGPVRPWSWRAYRWLQFGMWCALLLGPATVIKGVRANYRDRPSLQWPKVSGMIYQSEWRYVGHHNRGVFVSYSYYVNGQHYVGNQVSLWDPTGAPEGYTASQFVAERPLHSTVDVYYEPQHPGNSVLEPGAGEQRNRVAIWCGSILFALMAPLVFCGNRFLNKLVAWRKANPPKMRVARKHERIAAYPHGFVSYEPACEQKLKCFATRDDLDQFIGHDGKALQEWKPDDRIIDAKGQEYRLVPSGKKRYELEPTAGTWSWESMLEIAMADAKQVRKDPDAIRRRVTDAPAERRLPVLMKCIDEQAMGGNSWPAAVVLILFLVLFFFVVYFGFGLVAALIGKLMAAHSRH